MISAIILYYMLMFGMIRWANNLTGEAEQMGGLARTISEIVMTGGLATALGIIFAIVYQWLP